MLFQWLKNFTLGISAMKKWISFHFLETSPKLSCSRPTSSARYPWRPQKSLIAKTSVWKKRVMVAFEAGDFFYFQLAFLFGHLEGPPIIVQFLQCMYACIYTELGKHGTASRMNSYVAYEAQTKAVGLEKRASCALPARQTGSS